MHLLRFTLLLTVACYASANSAGLHIQEDPLNDLERQPGSYLMGHASQQPYQQAHQPPPPPAVQYYGPGVPQPVPQAAPMQTYQQYAPSTTTTARPYMQQHHGPSYAAPSTTAAPYHAVHQQYIQVPVRPMQHYAPAYVQPSTTVSNYAETTTTSRPYFVVPQQQYIQVPVRPMQQQYVPAYVQPTTTVSYYAETTTARPYHNAPQQQSGQAYTSTTTTRPVYYQPQQQQQYRPIYRPVQQHPIMSYPAQGMMPAPYRPSHRGSESDTEKE